MEDKETCSEDGQPSTSGAYKRRQTGDGGDCQAVKVESPLRPKGPAENTSLCDGVETLLPDTTPHFATLKMALEMGGRRDESPRVVLQGRVFALLERSLDSEPDFHLLRKVCHQSRTEEDHHDRLRRHPGQGSEAVPRAQAKYGTAAASALAAAPGQANQIAARRDVMQNAQNAEKAANPRPAAAKKVAPLMAKTRQKSKQSRDGGRERECSVCKSKRQHKVREGKD